MTHRGTLGNGGRLLRRRETGGHARHGPARHGPASHMRGEIAALRLMTFGSFPVGSSVAMNDQYADGARVGVSRIPTEHLKGPGVAANQPGRGSLARAGNHMNAEFGDH